MRCVVTCLLPAVEFGVLRVCVAGSSWVVIDGRFVRRLITVPSENATHLRTASSYYIAMDGQLSAAHRPSASLLDLVDDEWLCDSLSDDDLHLSDIGGSALIGGAVDEVDESAAVLQDRDGASWSLSVSAHSASSLANASASGVNTQTNNSISTPFGAGASGQQMQMAFAGSINAGAGSTSAVESADGLRWTDLALAGFAAQANKQPN